MLRKQGRKAGDVTVLKNEEREGGNKMNEWVRFKKHTMCGQVCGS